MSCHLPGLVETVNSIQFSCFSHVWLLWPHGLRQARPPCPSPAPGVYPNSYPLSWWCHPTISSSVIPFSSCVQSFPASPSCLQSFQWVSSSHQVARVLEFQLQHQSFQWIFRTDFLPQQGLKTERPHLEAARSGSGLGFVLSTSYFMFWRFPLA